MFCTSSEVNSIYINEEDDSNIFSSNKEIDSEIIPLGNFCDLCHKKYISFNIHSKSKEHIYLMRKKYKQYQNICNTFKRINSYYNNFINKKLIDSSISLSNLNSSYNNNFSTNDSLVNSLGNNYFTYEPTEILFRKYIGKKKKNN